MSTQAAERVFASKLRKTEMIEPDRMRQTFDMLALPGMQIVCISVIDDGSGDFMPISQKYQLLDGSSFDSLDEALLAWDDKQAEIELVDAIGQALLRHAHGLIRPLWEHRTPEQKYPWLTRARQFKDLAESLGLQITRGSRW